MLNKKGNILIESIIVIFFVILTICIVKPALEPVKAGSFNDYTEWQQEVIDLLEELVDKGEDISSDTQTIIDKL